MTDEIIDFTVCQCRFCGSYVNPISQACTCGQEYRIVTLEKDLQDQYWQKLKNGFALENPYERMSFIENLIDEMMVNRSLDFYFCIQLMKYLYENSCIR